ncbi:MAG TPA: hypothetical protein VFV11_02690 [Solimonas sp.]|nr:hypothetical protein [Solimonas sp.]
MNSQFQWARRVLCAGIVFALAACGGANTDASGVGTTAPPPPPTGAALSGSATLGPIGRGRASLFRVGANGQNNGAAVATVDTDANGNYAFPQRPDGNVRVCVTGGSFADEADGATTNNTLPNFCAMVGNGTATAHVNVATAFADAMAQGLAANGTGLDAARNQANAAIQAFFTLTAAPTAVQPMFTQPNAAQDPGGNRYRLGVFQGAYSQLGRRNRDRCGGGDRLERLRGLILDVQDGVFDGENGPDNDRRRVRVACGTVQEDLPTGTGTVELLTALDEFAATPLGEAMKVEEQTATREQIRTAVATGELAPVEVRVVPSQGLIAIDTSRNVGYAPVYTLDANGDARIAVLNLNDGVAQPVVTTISLPGSVQPIATSYDSVNDRLYAEARTSSNEVKVYVINPVTRTVLQTIDTPGMTHGGFFGGIIANPAKGKVIVVGTSDIGIIDISSGTPDFLENSVMPLFGTDSVALNFDTQLLFNASDGSNQVVDTSVVPPVVRTFSGGFGTTDGSAFDNLTNLLAVDPEFQDQTSIFNFNEVDLQASPVLAPNITVPGLGFTPPLGEGPGGQAAINILTHQAVIADEFGHNFRLIQLPTSPITGAPNNNGTPGTQTTADAESAFSIAAGILPTADLSGEGGSAQTQLGIRGDPNSLSIDPVRNRMYALVDTNSNFNQWPVGSTIPLFVIQIDLSQPVPGASPTATDGQGNPKRWVPASRLIRLP